MDNFNGKKIKILGATYVISISAVDDDPLLKGNHWVGYCNQHTKSIVIADFENSINYFEWDPKNTDADKETYFKETLRHEIIHAFLYESGLAASSKRCVHWAENEEMVDYFAIQFPKIQKVFQKLGILA